MDGMWITGQICVRDGLTLALDLDVLLACWLRPSSHIANTFCSLFFHMKNVEAGAGKGPGQEERIKTAVHCDPGENALGG